MEEITQKDGRTIIFISHNVTAIQQLCGKCILLDKGQIQKYGETSEVVSFYLNGQNIGEQSFIYSAPVEDNMFADIAELKAASLSSAAGNRTGDFGTGDDIYVNIDYEVKKAIDSMVVAYTIMNEENQAVFETTDHDTDLSVSGQKLPGSFTAKSKIPGKFLKPGKYYLAIGGHNPGQQHFFSAREALSFQVHATEGLATAGKARMGIVAPEILWNTIKDN